MIYLSDPSAPLYLRELVKEKNKSANTRLADDSLLLVVPSISKGSSNTFLNDRLFMLHLLSGTNWMVVLEKNTNFDSFKREIKTTLYLSYFDL